MRPLDQPEAIAQHPLNLDFSGVPAPHDICRLNEADLSRAGTLAIVGERLDKAIL
jgi:hypothetical protein